MLVLNNDMLCKTCIQCCRKKCGRKQVESKSVQVTTDHTLGSGSWSLPPAVAKAEDHLTFQLPLQLPLRSHGCTMRRVGRSWQTQASLRLLRSARGYFLLNFFPFLVSLRRVTYPPFRHQDDRLRAVIYAVLQSMSSRSALGNRTSPVIVRQIDLTL